jgi:hypothetical protein
MVRLCDTPFRLLSFMLMLKLTRGLLEQISHDYVLISVPQPSGFSMKPPHQHL